MVRGKQRGSEALLDAWKTRPGITEDLVRGIADLTSDLDVRDVLIKGQPPHIDTLRAAVATDDPERCGTVVVGVLNLLRKHGNYGIPTVRVFPHGIPWPDQFVVDVTVGEAGPSGS